MSYDLTKLLHLGAMEFEKLLRKLSSHARLGSLIDQIPFHKEHRQPALLQIALSLFIVLADNLSCARSV